LIDFRRTHRFGHTRATSLLNAGVPLHVVQRYFGHLSPRMTMHYAQTLAATHEREFLRFHKITADARPLAVDPRDLYDLRAQLAALKKQHHDELAALTAAHGELLQLRRQLGPAAA
jgi:hypothetical protein